MEIKKARQTDAYAIKFTAHKGGQEIARAYLYVLTNGLHGEPFGLMEDVFVEEGHRGQGVGTALIRAVIAEAKARGCYKLLGQSRYGREKVHEMYKKLGFKDHGKNFRMDI
ncbi:MAG TPA: GNAT family N-acetyltransferase [Candidatus Paceibacterota bacterium]|nr:GNAT family N-acetyltransferase [Candidatus Paceibacterota bacterium]